MGRFFDNCLFYREMPLLEELDVDRLGERSGNGGQRIYQNLAKIKAPRPKLIIDKDSTELVIDLNSENN
ncbi:MAG: hypothetical protein PUE28_03030 [Lactobacillus porci]|nr:hypothetical protein [Lactobacillus porci]